MIVIAMVVSVGIAVLMERVAYRPLRNAPRLAPLITAIGVSIVLQEGVRLFYGDLPGLPDAKKGISFPQIDYVTGSAIQLGGISVSRSALFTIAMLLICGLFLWYFVNRTRMGRAMQATSQDPDTARLMGINVNRVIVVAFAVGAALAAVAGVCHGLLNNNIDYKMGFLAGLKGFTAAVLGGIGNIAGAILGGLVLGVVEALATQLLPSAWKDVTAFALLILVLVFRPSGLLGARVVDRA